MNGNSKLYATIAICCVGLSALAQGTFPGPLSSGPLSDTFANRPVISGTDAVVEGSLFGATSEAGEPFIDGVSSGQTIWGTWTAPSNGIVELTVNITSEVTPFSPLLTVYAGSAPISALPIGTFPGSTIPTSIPSVFTNLSLIASNNYLACYDDGQCGCHWRERDSITFHVARGQTYQICIDSAIVTDASWEQQSIASGPYTFYSWGVVQMTNIFTGGGIALGLHLSPAPKNDDFVNRTKLAGSRVITTVSNAGATKEPGEPDHLGNPGGSSVWYSWTATASGRVTFSTNNVPAYSPPSSSGGYGGVVIISTPVGPTCGNEIDQDPPPVFYPVFAAYTGTTVDFLTSANCLPAALDAFPNMVEFDAVKGQTYQIAFDGNMGTTGDIPFYLALTQPASNDNFANRLQLHGIYAVATSYNAGATHQAGEPVFSDSAGKTVWWSWTAPVSGTVSIDLSGSDYSFPVTIFTGTTLAGLQMVAENSGGVSFEAIAGQTYQIAVSDLGGLTGAIDLKLQAPIVELPLLRAARIVFDTTQLSYAVSVGQIILFQRSNDGANWQNVQERTALRNTIQFSVRTTPAGNGPYYRAVVVDLQAGNRNEANFFK
jgi:hypothetical protein